MNYKHKTKPNIAREAFPEQFKALRPENSKAGGAKARSQPHAVRMAVYVPIRELFLTQNPLCQCCDVIYKHLHGTPSNLRVRFADEVHHKRGRDGLLLFDVRYWRATCRECHSFIHTHPKEAHQLKLIG